jgi:hypothetical protein
MNDPIFNPSDPANVTAHGVSSQGEIISPPESAPPITPARQWRTNIPRASNVAGSDGICTAQLGPVPSGQTWFMEWIRIKNNSTSPTALELYKNSIDDFHSLDSSPAAGNDNWFSAPGSTGYWLGESEVLILQWSGASTGAVGVVNAQVLING